MGAIVSKKSEKQNVEIVENTIEQNVQQNNGTSAAAVQNNNEDINVAAIVLHPGEVPEPPFELAEDEVFRIYMVELLGTGTSCSIMFVQPGENGQPLNIYEICKVDWNNRVADGVDAVVSYETFKYLQVIGDGDIRVFIERQELGFVDGDELDEDDDDDSDEEEEDWDEPENNFNAGNVRIVNIVQNVNRINVNFHYNDYFHESDPELSDDDNDDVGLFF